jgi:hypothetical protein
MQAILSVLQTLGQLSMHPLTGALFLLLVIAAASDYHSYRIPNWLTLSGVLYALVCNALLQASPYEGLLWSLQGLLLCFALTLPLYVFTMMGAGDVKLITMVGAFVGDCGRAVHVYRWRCSGAGIRAFAPAARSTDAMRRRFSPRFAGQYADAYAAATVLCEWVGRAAAFRDRYWYWHGRVCRGSAAGNPLNCGRDEICK